MEEFPFTAEDWNLVNQAGWVLVQATDIEDEILTAAAVAEMHAILAELTAKYGEHPVLLETAADYTDDPHERVGLYREARQLAVDNGLPSYTILISLAAVLIDDLSQPEAAREYLLKCQSEISALADDYEQQQWKELLAKCG